MLPPSKAPSEATGTFLPLMSLTDAPETFVKLASTPGFPG